MTELDCENCGLTDCPGCEEPDTCLGPYGHWYVITYGRAPYQLHARDCRTCDEDRTVEAYLPTFTRAYAHAMLWANVKQGEGEDMREVEPASWQSPSADWALEAFDASSRASIEEDCESFVRANLADLRDLDPEQCGHDFALTRNHHGAGFWDRGLGELGDRLTVAAHAFGESEGWVGVDDLVYLN